MSKILAVLGILAIGGWMFFPRPTTPYSRQTYVIVSDPVIVASWSEADRSLILMSFPPDSAAEGTHGYGTYSLTAFWRLGEIDKKDGTVLSESMSEALGIPVTGYIGPKTGTFAYINDAYATTKSVFSFQNIMGAAQTNIPVRTRIGLAWLFNFSRPERIRTYDFTGNLSAVAQDSVLADGSTVKILDPQRLDSQLNAIFEDESVRRESVTVAVYNTTGMPSLGNRAGRLLTNLGVSVVTVGNDTPQVDRCSIAGSPAALKSKSAQVIVAVLGCTPAAEKTTRADLILRIGGSYAKRFLPN